MTADQFLAWEREQELRYEFDGIGPVAMNGGSIEHSEIATNLASLLRDRLDGTPCRAIRGDLKVVVAGRIRYPDLVVTCTPIPRGADIVPEPVVVFEVLSPSTSRVDRRQVCGVHRHHIHSPLRHAGTGRDRRHRDVWRASSASSICRAATRWSTFQLSAFRFRVPCSMAALRSTRWMPDSDGVLKPPLILDSPPARR